MSQTHLEVNRIYDIQVNVKDVTQPRMMSNHCIDVSSRGHFEKMVTYDSIQTHLGAQWATMGAVGCDEMRPLLLLSIPVTRVSDMSGGRGEMAIVLPPAHLR